MGRIVVTEFMSLDGVMEEPRWTFDFERGEAGDRFKYEELFDADALLLGRRTYEGFGAAWPSMGHDDFGQRMNAIAKYVVSRSLKEADAQWGPTTILRGELAEEVGRLRDEFQGTLLVEGSAQLVHGLARADLVDAYRLMVFPVLLGAGKTVFPPEMPESRRLELVDQVAAGTGVMMLRYERTR